MALPYHVKPETVQIESSKLLFWPDNPRLKISDYSEVHFEIEDLLNPKNQKKIYELLAETEEHDVKKLVKSMAQTGFMPERAPIVMKVESTDKYLVLEGNRRLSAIRTILGNPDAKISATNKKSLKKIPCWLFVHDSDDVPLKAAISRMVAEAHVKGQKQHTKLQQAHMLYNAFEGFLIEKNGASAFVKDQDLIQKTADFFGFTYKELETDLAVVVLFKQLKNAGLEIPAAVEKKLRERLSWVSLNPRQFKKFFEYSPGKCNMGSEGLERYYDVFVKESAPVSNPAKFKQLQEIMRNGDLSDIEAIRSEPECFDDIVKRIRQSKVDNRFLEGVSTVERRINALRLSDFRGTKAERKKIESIVNLVENRLALLLAEADGQEAGEVGDHSMAAIPASVDDALIMSSTQLGGAILDIVEVQPNCSCVRSKVPTLLLKEWGLRTRGAPREAFVSRVDEEIEKLDLVGKLEIYRATNERVRVPRRF